MKKRSEIEAPSVKLENEMPLLTDPPHGGFAGGMENRICFPSSAEQAAQRRLGVRTWEKPESEKPE